MRNSRFACGLVAAVCFTTFFVGRIAVNQVAPMPVQPTATPHASTSRAKVAAGSNFVATTEATKASRKSMDFSMSSAFETAWKTKSERLSFDEHCRFDRSRASVACKLTFYGKSSLKLKYTKRRSLSVVLSRPVEISGVNVSKLILLSLWEDRTRIAYRTSTLLLESMGLFFSAATFLELTCAAPVCGKTLGVYLAIEDPVESIRRYVTNRKDDSQLCRTKFAHPILKQSGNLAIASRNWFYFEKPSNYDLLDVPSFARNSSLSTAYKKIESNLLEAHHFDIDQYLAWIAVNSLLQNGDYDDEVFFFGGDSYVGIMAWDYDSIFSPCHRKGAQAIRTELMYCAETPIEAFILRNPLLLDRYKNVLRCVLSTIANPAVFRRFALKAASELDHLLSADVAKATLDECCRDPLKSAENLAQAYEHRVFHFQRLTSRHPRECTKISAMKAEYKNSAEVHKTLVVQHYFRNSTIKKGILGEGMYCLSDDCNTSKIVVVRSRERGKSEFGLAHFHMLDIGSMITSLPGEAMVRTTVPRNWLFNAPFPVIFQSFVADVWMRKTFPIALGTQRSVVVRGFSAVFVDAEEKRLHVRPGVDVYRPDHININQATVLTLSSSQLAFPCVFVVEVELVIPKGDTLTIQKGCCVILRQNARLSIEGTLKILGTEDFPVTLMHADASERFDSIAVTGRAEVQWCFISGSGGGLPRPGTGTHHSHSAAITLLPKASLAGHRLFVLNSKGPLIAAGARSKIELRNSILQWAHLGVECVLCDVHIEDSVLTHFPNDSVDYVDDDNDGVYLSGGRHNIQNSVIANCKDDGIDTGTPEKYKGDGGSLLVENTIIERVQHEGVAFSGSPLSKRHMIVRNSLIQFAQQGVEMGYSGDSTTALVEGCEIDNCMVGIRYGDNYHGRALSGRLTVKDSILHDNEVNVLNYLRDAKGPGNPNHVVIKDSILRAHQTTATCTEVLLAFVAVNVTFRG